jgi:protein SCO1/2
MRAGQRGAWGVALLVAAALGATTCGSEPEGGYPGHGIVMSVDAQARQVTLDHDDIPGLMQGMTMTFELAPEVSLEGIGPGSRVRFTVRREGRTYTLTELRPSGS